jgi:hypothetical protein
VQTSHFLGQDSNLQPFGAEPNALSRQQLIDNEEIHNNETLGLKTFGTAENAF